MQLWGLKTDALFDVWSIEHFFAGMNARFAAVTLISTLLPSLLEQLNKVHRLRLELLVVCLLAFGWEVLEHYLETGLAGDAVTYWFQGVEHWANRLISDTVLVLAGTVAVYHYPFLSLPARLFSAIWLAVHIFIFPHSMYLHTLF